MLVYHAVVVVRPPVLQVVIAVVEDLARLWACIVCHTCVTRNDWRVIQELEQSAAVLG